MRMMRTFLVVLLIVVVLSVVMFVSLDQPSISDATYEQLIEVEDIGEGLAVEILNYLHFNPEATIDDLHHIKYIGEKRIENIKEVFD